MWSGANAAVQVYRVPAAGLIIGRELLQSTTDDRISRQHARVVWKDRRFVVTDLGSRNGTYAGGHALIDREVTVTPPSVVRTGRTVCVLLEDIRRFEKGSIETRHDAIVGASTHPLWMQMEHAAQTNTNLLIIGESGSGKGRMARGYARVRGRPEKVFNPTVQAVPLALEYFALEAEMGGQRFVMVYYVARQAAGGVTVAARLLPKDATVLQREVESIARSLRLRK